MRISCRFIRLSTFSMFGVDKARDARSVAASDKPCAWEKRFLAALGSMAQYAQLLAFPEYLRLGRCYRSTNLACKHTARRPLSLSEFEGIVDFHSTNLSQGE